MDTQIQTTYDDYTIGNDLPEQVITGVGLRRVQHFNESPYHKGTVIAAGGYGIPDGDESAPEIGPRQTIRHLSGRSSEMRVAREIEVALIGISPKYYVAEFDDPRDESRRVSLVVPRYLGPEELPGKRARCRSAISFFVALRVDPSRKLYELTFRGFSVADATLVANRIRRLASKASAYIKSQTGKTIATHPFLVWSRLGVVEESRLVGKKEQSPITPPTLVTPDDVDIASIMVSGGDFRRFVELRRELDEYLANGRYAGVQLSMLPPGPGPFPGLPSGS